MIVAHICQSSNTSIGGSLVVARALVEAQRKQGIDARLVYLYQDPAELPPGAGTTDVQCRVTRGSRWLTGIRTLKHVLREIRPDIIHHHDGLLWPRIATSALNTPLITHGHLGRPSGGVLSGSHWTHWYIARHTNALVAISEWVSESWANGGFPRDKIRLISNGVDCARFFKRSKTECAEIRAALKVPENVRLVLWAGRLDRETKGLDRLTAVAEHLNERAKLIVAGEGPSREWLTSQLRRPGLACDPLLLGNVTDPEKLFGACDVFLFTSKIEPFGLVLLEAAASGLPLLAFECTGGGRELLDKLGAFISRDECGNEIANLLTLEPFPVDAPSCKYISELFSWTTSADETIALYSELLRSRRQK